MSNDALEVAEEKVKRVTIDLPENVADFLTRLANYRNLVNELSKRTVRSKWSGKSVSEAFVLAQYAATLKSMEQVFADFGDIPSDPDELRAYVEKVLERTETPSKKR